MLTIDLADGTRATAADMNDQLQATFPEIGAAVRRTFLS